MKQQIILSALEAQLAVKLETLNNYDSETYAPALQEVSTQALAWLQDYVTPLIKNVTITPEQVSFHRVDGTRYDSCSVYIRRNWRTDEQKISFSWYSTTADETNVDALTDVQIFGAVAAHLSHIKQQILEVWQPAIQAIESNRSKLSLETDALASEIYGIKAQIQNTERAKYSEVGFEIEKFNSSTSYDYSTNELTESEHVIRFQTGKSRYNCIGVTGYKVVSFEKGKYTVLVKSTEGRSWEVQVSPMRMEELAKDVYSWQTSGSASWREKQEKRKELYAKA